LDESESIIEVRALTVIFSSWGQNVRALDAVTLNVPPGEWLIIVGPNGSGKSSLLATLAAQLKPDSGSVIINGKAVTAMSDAELARNIFLINQNPALGSAPQLTLFENLFIADLGAAGQGVSKKALRHRYEQLLSPVGLAGRLDQLVTTLSRGQQQLLAILIARLRGCPIVLLDEPLASLDPKNAQLCLEAIDELARGGTTLVHVLHNEQQASTLGSRTVVLRQGQLVFDSKGTDRTTSALREHWYVPTGAL
jgi:putative ABC transport system ATP-binding protein